MKKEDLIAAGCPPEEVDKLLAWSEKMDEHLNDLECPDCSGELTVNIDPRQDGFTEAPGAWHNYRCTKCKFMMDRVVCQ